MLPFGMDFYFFFQAEDGIRDLYVTGVQTCALPISAIPFLGVISVGQHSLRNAVVHALPGVPHQLCQRSEERRVGKECRYRGSQKCQKKMPFGMDPQSVDQIWLTHSIQQRNDYYREY